MRVCLLAHNSHGTALYRTVNHLLWFWFCEAQKKCAKNHILIL